MLLYILREKDLLLTFAYNLLFLMRRIITYFKVKYFISHLIFFAVESCWKESYYFLIVGERYNVIISTLRIKESKAILLIRLIFNFQEYSFRLN